MQPLKDSVGSALSISINEHRLSYVSSPGKASQESTACLGATHSLCHHAPLCEATWVREHCSFPFTHSEDASKLCLFWDAGRADGSSRSRAGGEEDSLAKIIRMGKSR